MTPLILVADLFQHPLQLLVLLQDVLEQDLFHLLEPSLFSQDLSHGDRVKSDPLSASSTTLWRSRLPDPARALLTDSIRSKASGLV